MSLESLHENEADKSNVPLHASYWKIESKLMEISFIR